jgi:uncharacterized protein YodC (DUF2158 family)
MIKRYKVGDVVVLKGGSPAMTIIEDELGTNNGIPSFNGNYKCSYFEATYEVRRIYPQESIKIMDYKYKSSYEWTKNSI